MASENKMINSANVFNLSKGQLTAIPTASGNVAVNTLIANTTPPRSPRVESIDLLGDVLGAVGAGAEIGTSGTGNPNVTDLSKTLGVVGKINDAFAVFQHVGQGNGAEAVSEGMGVGGGSAGAAAGFWGFGKTGLILSGGNPIVAGGAAVAGAAVGAYGGSSALKFAGEYLTGGNTPDKLGPPTTLPNSTPLQPTAVDSSGKSYALVNVDGKFTWFAMLDNTSLPNRFVEVVSGPKVAELTNSYLKEAGFTDQLQDLKARIDIAHQNGTLDTSVLGNNYNFSDTAGAGRGVVNPDAGTPNTPDKPTVFNASTALPNYSGDNAVTVLPGDTVSSISKRYDMSEQEFSGFLKGQYGEGADLNSIVAGHKLPLPPEVYERTSGGVNGLDLPPEVAPAQSPDAKAVNDALADAFSKADQSAADIKAQYPGTLVADAGGGVSDTSTHANTNTFSNYLDSQGSSFSPAQQQALATQIDKLGLGGEADLSFYNLPGGGTLIANADGDIVGEINHSDAGDLNLRATAIDAEGNAVQVSQHISESGQSLTDAQYSQQQLTQLSAGLGLVNNFQGLQNWDDLSDLSRLSTLVGNPAQSIGSLVGMCLGGPIGAAIGGMTRSEAVNDEFFRSVA